MSECKFLPDKRVSNAKGEIVAVQELFTGGLQLLYSLMFIYTQLYFDTSGPGSLGSNDRTDLRATVAAAVRFAELLDGFREPKLVIRNKLVESDKAECLMDHYAATIAILNPLINARKYTATPYAAEKTVYAGIGRNDDREIEISIDDAGKGMPPADLKLLGIKEFPPKARSMHIGMKLVGTLLRSSKSGRLQVEPSARGGLRVKLIFTNEGDPL